VLRAAGMILAQLEVPVETLSWLAAFCTQSAIPLMLDPAPAQKLPAALFAGLSWFTPNQTETAFYGNGSAETEEIVAGLFRSGVRNVILKEGADGALLADAGGGRKRIAPFPVKAVDTTAAGDSFNGAFAVGLMRGMSSAESAQFAAAAAAISVTRPGSQSSLPTDEEVRAMLQRV
jgi:ribokinase